MKKLLIIRILRFYAFIAKLGTKNCGFTLLFGEKSIYRVHKPSANNQQRQGTSLQGAESDVPLTTAKGQRATCKQGTSLQGTMITRHRRNQNFLREKKYILTRFLIFRFFSQKETRRMIAAPSGLRQGTGTKVGNPVEVNSENDIRINERRSNLRTNHEIALLQCVTSKKRKAPSVVAACPDETFLSLSLKMRKELLQFLLNSKRPELWESCRSALLEFRPHFATKMI
ncbi:hypothetical protein L5515_017361 [Caenorhabditis briggsae]|uniref:Uncharacterized protein n=1 Tax=Caenorhabditis briggsae TaxID=6238 RepID=A0AAE9FGQ2_CAEBR|nr:hypothetical protein L5515_017361 [Caenorhabditis briggsae]